MLLNKDDLYSELVVVAGELIKKKGHREKNETNTNLLVLPFTDR